MSIPSSAAGARLKTANVREQSDGYRIELIERAGP
jgi:hypothetical protein